MSFEDPDVARIVAFLEGIGIPVSVEPVADAFLPGVTVQGGGIVFDPAMPYPGDLLHEAGHIAVTDPAERPTLNEVSSDPGEEMAAIAWSYAAALAAGVDPRLVFHDHGYKGGGGYLIEALTGSSPVGAPLLQVYRMSGLPRDAERLGLPVYPVMARWLR
jgi:hypothetical protein